MCLLDTIFDLLNDKQTVSYKCFVPSLGHKSTAPIEHKFIYIRIPSCTNCTLSIWFLKANRLSSNFDDIFRLLLRYVLCNNSTFPDITKFWDFRLFFNSEHNLNLVLFIVLLVSFRNIVQITKIYNTFQFFIVKNVNSL